MRSMLILAMHELSGKMARMYFYSSCQYLLRYAASSASLKQITVWQCREPYVMTVNYLTHSATCLEQKDHIIRAEECVIAHMNLKVISKLTLRWKTSAAWDLQMRTRIEKNVAKYDCITTQRSTWQRRYRTISMIDLGTYCAKALRAQHNRDCRAINQTRKSSADVSV